MLTTPVPVPATVWSQGRERQLACSAHPPAGLLDRVDARSWKLHRPQGASWRRGLARAWLAGEELDKGEGRGLASGVQRGGNGPEGRAEQGWVSGFRLAWRS